MTDDITSEGTNPDDVAVPVGPAEPVRTAPGPRPLRTVGWGLVLVLVDIRVQGFDLLPDVVGWVLVALGTRRFVIATRRFTAGRPLTAAPALAVLAAWLSAVLAGADVLARLAGDVRPGWVANLLGTGGIALGGELFSVAAVVSAVVVLALTGVVAQVAGGAEDTVSAYRWNRLRFVYLCTALPGLLMTFVMSFGVGSGAALVLSSVLMVVGLVVVVLVTVRCFRDTHRPWALAAGSFDGGGPPDATAAASSASISA